MADRMTRWRTIPSAPWPRRPTALGRRHRRRRRAVARSGRSGGWPPPSGCRRRRARSWPPRPPPTRPGPTSCPGSGPCWPTDIDEQTTTPLALLREAVRPGHRRPRRVRGRARRAGPVRRAGLPRGRLRPGAGHLRGRRPRAEGPRPRVGRRQGLRPPPPPPSPRAARLVGLEDRNRGNHGGVGSGRRSSGASERPSAAPNLTRGDHLPFWRLISVPWAEIRRQNG